MDGIATERRGLSHFSHKLQRKHGVATSMVGCSCQDVTPTFWLRMQHMSWLVVGTYQPVDHHGLHLAQPVAPVLCLAVYLGIEIHVVQDDCVCPCKVQSLPPRPGAEQEGKHSILRVVEPAGRSQTVVLVFNAVGNGKLLGSGLYGCLLPTYLKLHSAADILVHLDRL